MKVNYSFYQRLSIGLKLILLPLLFIAALLVLMWYFISAQQAQNQYTQVVTLVARQRALNQWYIRDLFADKTQQVQRYAYFRDEFFKTAESLRNGGMVTSNLFEADTEFIVAAPTQTIKASLDEQVKLFQELVGLEKQFLSLPFDSNEFRQLYQRVNQISLEVHQAGRNTLDLYKAYVQAHTDNTARNVLLLGLLIIGFKLLLNSMISKSITVPLIALAEKAGAVSEGKLNGVELAVQSGDEVGQLTESFNQMVFNLREMAQQNDTSAKELGTAIAEILASTQQQSASTQEQVAALQETMATMEEVRQSSAQIAQRATEVSRQGEQTTQNTEEGELAIGKTVEAMETIRTQVNEVAENIVLLSEKNRAVGDIIAMVTHLAERSNLLALNAAIEAASAGENGRSFGVVASEMKHLAEQAKEATKEVRSMLDEIQKGISKSVMLTEEAVKRVEMGSQQIHVSSNTIRYMADATQNSIQAFQQIVAATNQQHLGLEQIFQALQDIRQSTEQNAMSTQQLTRAASGLNTMSQQLHSVMSRYQL